MNKKYLVVVRDRLSDMGLQFSYNTLTVANKFANKWKSKGLYNVKIEEVQNE